jgi:single-stranded-DNA-specific exonuclease
MHKTWVGPPSIDESVVPRLVRELGVPLIVARVLASRGRAETGCARAFLHPSLSTLSSPKLLRGADVAIERLNRAIAARERILVFGDFDVDGVTGTSLALLALRRLGADVDFFLPHRIDHGYGLSMKALPEILARRPAVLITVDCAIRSVDEIAALTHEGIDVLVTDHHEPGPVLPPALSVIDPKQSGCSYPDKRLAAVGVVYQLLQGLAATLEHDLDLAQHLDLVALGTIADLVPLDGENRALVAAGLEVMNRHEKIGILRLAEVSGVEGRIEAWHVAYLLGPRINAAGRLGDASAAVRLLTATDTTAASAIARDLDESNRRRQEISQATLLQAVMAIERGTAGKDPAGIVLASNHWHPGVIGIATSKLVEMFHRPVALIAMDGDRGRGSVRSIPGVDICAVLDRCQDLLVQYGGHEMAAGLTIERDRIQAFRERFSSAAHGRLTHENSQPIVRIDCEISPEEIDVPLLEDLDALAPFGLGNARPTFILRKVEVAGSTRVVGRGHLKMQLRRRGMPPLDCIGFDLGARANGETHCSRLDLVGHVAANDWNGRRIAQVQIVDFRPSESGTP